MRVGYLLALALGPISALAAECETKLSAAQAAMDALDAPRALRTAREAEAACGSIRSGVLLARVLYANTLQLPARSQAPGLREAYALIEQAGARGAHDAEFLCLRAALAGAIAQRSRDNGEKARLIHAVYRDATRAHRLDPEAPAPMLILGAWHRNVSQLGVSKRTYIRLTEGALPQASMSEARRLHERAAAVRPSPTALLFLGETRLADGAERAARQTWQRCVETKPHSLADVAFRKRCGERLDDLARL